MAMINLYDIDILRKCRSTLQETSFNDAQNVYMTMSQMEAINFDEVKEEYIRPLSLKEGPTSNDALVQTAGEVYFIEFKDGRANQYNIRRKIYESLLLYCDITKQQISDTRGYMTYILVYNEEALRRGGSTQGGTYRDNVLAADEIQDSPSVRGIMDAIASKTTQVNADKFGLRGMFKGLYFREVLTYDKNAFADDVLV